MVTVEDTGAGMPEWAITVLSVSLGFLTSFLMLEVKSRREQRQALRERRNDVLGNICYQLNQMSLGLEDPRSARRNIIEYMAKNLFLIDKDTQRKIIEICQKDDIDPALVSELNERLRKEVQQ